MCRLPALGSVYRLPADGTRRVPATIPFQQFRGLRYFHPCGACRAHYRLSNRFRSSSAADGLWPNRFLACLAAPAVYGFDAEDGGRGQEANHA